MDIFIYFIQFIRALIYMYEHFMPCCHCCCFFLRYIIIEIYANIYSVHDIIRQTGDRSKDNLSFMSVDLSKGTEGYTTMGTKDGKNLADQSFGLSDNVVDGGARLMTSGCCSISWL